MPRRGRVTAGGGRAPSTSWFAASRTVTPNEIGPDRPHAQKGESNMQTSKQKSAARGTLAAVAAGIATAALSFAAAQAEDAKSPYPNMAPIEQYRSASQADEVALAKSAAPPAISNSAEVLIMGERGYETAVKGTNGFVCLVQRSWASDFTSNEFWNPKMRGPECFNPAAARSVLPSYLERTRWVLAGATEAEVIERTKAALAAKKIGAPEV